MRFSDLAATSAAVSGVAARKAKVELLAAALRQMEPAEIAAGAAYLAGELRQRQTGVGYAGLRDLPPPAVEPALTIGEVDARIAAISVVAGAGSQGRRRELVGELFGRATADEQRFLVGLFGGEIRQGAQAGLLADAVAQAAEVPLKTVRRALLLSGDLKQVAVTALTGGAGALAGISLRVGTALSPMLASSAPDVAKALEGTGAPATVDEKLDGIRIQVHRSGDDVQIFTRSLDTITERLPAVVEAVRALPIRDVILDGEAMVLGADGRPRPFQEIASQAATRKAQRADEAASALVPYFFDLLHLDGRDLIDEPGRVRWEALAATVPGDLIVGRSLVETGEQAAGAFAAAVAAGQEGVVIKNPDSLYDVGRRGAAWIKVKPRHTLDLVVLAVEWGHGRRKGWLSNLHLGARDPGTGGFVMLGKTFKGLTDELLRWQTERFRELAVDDSGWVVTVRPEQVVEIAFDGVQTSPRYPGGVALRFARVLRYRHDKKPAEADTIETVRALNVSAQQR